MSDAFSLVQLDAYGIKRTRQAIIDPCPRLLALRVLLRLPDTAIQPRGDVEQYAALSNSVKSLASVVCTIQSATEHQPGCFTLLIA